MFSVVVWLDLCRATSSVWNFSGRISHQTDISLTTEYICFICIYFGRHSTWCFTIISCDLPFSNAIIYKKYIYTHLSRLNSFFVLRPQTRMMTHALHFPPLSLGFIFSVARHMGNIHSPVEKLAGKTTGTGIFRTRLLKTTTWRELTVCMIIGESKLL